MPNTVWSRLQQPVQPPNQHLPLNRALAQYDQLCRRRFHVPAHSGFWVDPYQQAIFKNPLRYDLSELDRLDVLSEPDGCLAESQALIAETFGAAYSFMLVNGASSGLQAALLASIKPGDTVLVARNAHRSVLSGLILTGAIPIWFLPERLPEWGLWGGVTAESVAKQLALNPDTRALVLTSPTYEGIGSDISGIAALCKQRGVTLIVDEAHGSLWHFSEVLPPSAVSEGADIVIHSLHKGGGCLTQGALAHLPPGSRIAPDMFQQALNMVLTTSPSYLLMASLEAASLFLGMPHGQAKVAELYKTVSFIREQLKAGFQSLQANKSGFRLFEPYSNQMKRRWDPAKIFIAHSHQPGEEWASILESEKGLAYESVTPYGTLYLANLGMPKEDADALVQTFLQAREQGYITDISDMTLLEQLTTNPQLPLLPTVALSPRDAYFAAGESVIGQAAIGRIAKSTIVHCPPGIPVLMPGERIQASHIPLLPPAGILVI